MNSLSSASARHRLTAVWVGAAVVLSIGCGAVAIGADRVSPAETATEVVTVLVIATFAFVGAIVTLNAPDNIVGRLLLITAVLWACSQAMTEAGVRGLRDGSIVGANYYATFGVTLRLPTVILIGVVIPVLFPDGRAPTPRARRLVAAAVAAALLGGLGSLLSPQENRLPYWRGVLDLTGPSAVAGQLLVMLAVLGSIVVAVGAVTGMRARWRREGALVRQQLLLFATAVAASALFLTGVIISVFATSGGPPRWTFAVAVLPLPLAIAVATLRHGLYVGGGDRRPDRLGTRRRPDGPEHAGTVGDLGHP